MSAERSDDDQVMSYKYNNPTVGADGLTGDQWAISSRPGNQGMADGFRGENRREEREAKYGKRQIQDFEGNMHNVYPSDICQPGEPCNSDQYITSTEDGRTIPGLYHTKKLPLGDGTGNLLANIINNFVHAIDCGCGGKTNNYFDVEIGQHLISEKFSSGGAFNTAKKVWLERYVYSAADTKLRSFIENYINGQEYSNIPWGNKTLNYIDIGIANSQYSKVRDILLRAGVPYDNIRVRFNHASNSSDPNAYISVQKYSFLLFGPRGPRP